MGQVFSCEFYKISRNTFYCRTPPAAASEKTINLNEKPCGEINFAHSFVDRGLSQELF